jgi:general secretion pathway protein D
MRRVLLAAAACYIAIAGAPALAQDSPEARPSAPDSSVPLEKLIASVAKKTGKTFVIDPRVSARVTVLSKSPGEISYAELLTVLDTYGFAAVEDSGLVRVVPDTVVRSLPVPTITPKDTRPASEYVTEIITLKNVSAVQLVPILRPLVPTPGTLAAVMETNSLIIMDRFANLRRIEGLIRTLDNTPLHQPAARPTGTTGAESEH